MSDNACCQGKTSGCCKEKPAPTPIPRLGLVPDQARFAALPTQELVARFRRGVENFDRRLFWLTDEQLDQAFLPDVGVGRWPTRVVLGHLADADLVAVHRMRRIFAEDQPMLAEWDENAFVDRNIYGLSQGVSGGGSVGAFVAIIHTLRQWTALWAASLSEQDLKRTGMHPTKGPQSIRDILALYTWHLEHHAAYVNAKIERFLGEPTADDVSAPGGSCGAGCGCKK